jgi:hypothetical protein
MTTDGIRQITDLQGLAPALRAHIAAALAPMTAAALAFDFYREWNGGWRVRVELSGNARGTLDFVLVYTPNGAWLALPHPAPSALRGRPFPASDNTWWAITDEGDIVTSSPPS